MDLLVEGKEISLLPSWKEEDCGDYRIGDRVILEKSTVTTFVAKRDGTKIRVHDEYVSYDWPEN
jgi:hypothetical protein